MIRMSSFVDELMKISNAATAVAEAAPGFVSKAEPFVRRHGPLAASIALGGAGVLTADQARKDWALGRAIRKQQGGAG